MIYPPKLNRPTKIYDKKTIIRNKDKWNPNIINIVNKIETAVENLFFNLRYENLISKNIKINQRENNKAW